MGTVLAEQPPFLENFSYSTLLDEQGRPMHKSSGNSIEFNEAADKMGVDVMRWMYCAHKPENNLLFGYNAPTTCAAAFSSRYGTCTASSPPMPAWMAGRPADGGFDPPIPRAPRPR